MEQLLARGTVVPVAVSLEARQQRICSFLPLALARKADREIEAGLMIVGIGVDLMPQLRKVADVARLVGKVQCGLGRDDRLVLGARGRHLGQKIAGGFEIACRDQCAREAADRADMVGIALEDR